LYILLSKIQERAYDGLLKCLLSTDKGIVILHYVLAERVHPIEITNDIGFPGWLGLNLD